MGHQPHGWVTSALNKPFNAYMNYMTAHTRVAFPRSTVRDLVVSATRHNDLLLAGLLIAIVALFVLPLPTALLDLLIATNLAVSLTLLIVAMYVPSALSLSTFPSLLLFTTLFRLALNIASTKLILLHADAGRIIDTFGKLIVGNNIVVGGVVFLIIAIVQFIVIAKGSERVAEVAARFALDAMPGKQMSIDADVRAGVLSTAQAQQRRQVLEQECQLHGSMDGAMKFVKGDAIASIIIALINILAGVAIGTLMHNMSVGAALQRYAILTVGDGMVSQIPSLLVSIAAGIVITRVSTGESKDQQLAKQMWQQLLAHPRALVIAGLAVASFLVVPGFPKWVFALLAGAVLAIGLVTRKVHQTSRTPEWIRHEAQSGPGDAGLEAAIAAPLALRFSSSLREALNHHLLDQQMNKIKAAVESDLGPIFPRLQTKFSNDVADNTYQILVHDVVVSTSRLKPGWLLFELEPGHALPQGAEPAEPFNPFDRVAWAPSVPAGVKAHPCEEVLAIHTESVVRKSAHKMIGLQEVQKLLHAVQREAPDLAAEVSRVASGQRIAEVLRRLLQEGIPIRNLHAIFESLAVWAVKEQDAIALTELVRTDLGRYITSRYVDASRQLEAILFESNLLERVQASIEKSARGNLLLLSPAATQDIRDQVQRILASTSKTAVAIASSDTRRYIKTLIEPAAPHLAVLSYQELDDDVGLRPIGWVSNPKAA
jgi:type III secretion protein V